MGLPNPNGGVHQPKRCGCLTPTMWFTNPKILVAPGFRAAGNRKQLMGVDFRAAGNGKQLMGVHFSKRLSGRQLMDFDPYAKTNVTLFNVVRFWLPSKRYH